MRLKTAVALLILIAGCLVSAWPGHSLAATGTIYISPGSTSVQVGSDVTIGLRINPGTTVNTAQATINYDPSALQFLSTSLSAFPVCTQNSGGGGSVTVACAILAGSTSSDSLIANVSFQALKGSGSTSLTISNAEAANNGVYTDPSTAGGTISLTSPAPAPTPTPPTTTTHGSSSTKTTGTTSAATTTPAPTATTTAPTTKVILKVSDGQIEYNKASIKVSSNVLAKFYIKYGTNKSNLSLKTTPTDPAKTASIGLDPSSLTPGTEYYYQVVTESSDGTTTLSQSSLASFKTKGYSLSVTVLDNQYHPIAGKIVTLHSTPMTAVTNSNGVATFINVAPGVHHVEYQNKSQNYSQTVYVANALVTKGGTQSAPLQTAAVVLSNYRQPKQFPIAIVLIIVLVIAVLGYILVTPKLYKYINSPNKTASMEKMATVFPKTIELHHK